jgi:hypothetical protein
MQALMAAAERGREDTVREVYPLGNRAA